MNKPLRHGNADYGITIHDLQGTVSAWLGDTLIAQSEKARVMFETRLGPAVYFPVEDLQIPYAAAEDLQTFCPFKGTASYLDLTVDGQTLEKSAWIYEAPLPESLAIQGCVAFMPDASIVIDAGDNDLSPPPPASVSGPIVDWLLRDAASCASPEDLTGALGRALNRHGISVSRISIMIWSLHPQIAGRSFVWHRDTDEVTSYAPSYELYDHPSYVNSPLRHVSNGLGGVRQRLDTDQPYNSFPILEDLREQGATDYVAMPMIFSDGKHNVLSLTSDHEDGFSTAGLGLIFECSAILSRYFEVFTLRENAKSLLETYVGKRSGTRVLGGEIRRGDGDEIDAAILFCDLRGSTELEERLGRAEYLNLLNDFFEIATDITEEHGGEVLKFIGDAVLAIFPAGESPSLARAHATQAAQEIVARLQTDVAQEKDVPCECSIGIAYGPVTYGNVGSRTRLDFTVIGRAANVAARLSDYAKPNGHCIVVSGDAMPEGQTEMMPLGAVSLRNVSRPVDCYAIKTAS